MQCKCGFVFRPQSDDYEGFMVVRNADYKKFIRWEVKALTSKESVDRRRAVGKAAQMVGSLKECPECNRMCLYRAGADGVDYLVFDKH